MYDLDWQVVVDNRDSFLAGLLLALRLAVFGLGIGAVVGLLVAFARTSRFPLLSIPAAAYVEVIRNIPLLLLLFFFYFGLPIFALRTFSRDTAQRFILDGDQATILALSIYAGAYLSEVFRSGILSVSKRYLDAGRSVGLTGIGVARYVTTPIMFRAVLPALSNTFISLFKDTSLASAIAVEELTFATRELSTDTFRVIEAWSTGGALYLVTCYALALVLRWLERRIRWSV
ncbi:MAG: polar amino acid transport system permease protein [Thermomicrobiales bacterium]|nr:polar amino acid transport system permease protein [Thermomicrobiales bacterium]MEA2524843.1 polar amino acid transport system permease protein [Thermomicrobiales bacterium]MEA2595490.1 polar amino acid transport system permease protein [Thermomicrobiales bacterium]